jgi:hypothetical protein
MQKNILKEKNKMELGQRVKVSYCENHPDNFETRIIGKFIDENPTLFIVERDNGWLVKDWLEKENEVYLENIGEEIRGWIIEEKYLIPMEEK